MVTRTLNLLGAYLGPDRSLMRADEANPEGYWERFDIFQIQERFLAQLNLTWDTALPLPADWHRSAGSFRGELKSLIATEFARQRLWAWKDPRTCLLLPIWKSVLQELDIVLRCIFVVRSPVDVAASLKRRDGIPLQKGYEIWFNHTLAALRESADLPLALVSYDSFLESWQAELRKCAAALKLNWPVDISVVDHAVSSFVRPQLRHCRSSPVDLEALPSAVRQLYALVLQQMHRPESGSPADADTFDRLAREQRCHSSFFEPDLRNRPAAGTRRHAVLNLGCVIFADSDPDQTIRCVRHLNRAGVPDTDMVLVTHSSHDQMPQSLTGRADLRTVPSAEHEARGAAWNTAAQEICDRWLVFLSSSVLVAPGFREGLADFVRGRHRDVISPALGEGPPDYDYSSFAEAFVRKMGSAFRRGVAWPEIFMVDRRVFRSIGWFDTRLDLAKSIAADFFRRAAKAGFRLAVTGRTFAYRVTYQANPPGGLKLSLPQRTRSMLCRWAEAQRFGLTLRMRRDDGQWFF